MSDVVIVSRHPGAVEWLREQGLDGTVYPSVTEEDVRGRWVVGNLPLKYAVLARGVLAIEFDGAPPRGAEYGAEEMKAAGARLSAYFVSRESSYPSYSCRKPEVPESIRPWIDSFAYDLTRDCVSGTAGYRSSKRNG